MTDPRTSRLERAVRAVTGGDGLEAVLHNTVTAAREALGVDFAAAGAFGAEGFVSHVEQGLGEPSTLTEAWWRAGIDSALRRLAHRAEVVRLPPLQSVTEHRRQHPGAVGEACLGVPVRTREGTLGALLVCRGADDSAPFTSEDEDFLTGLAAVAGQSLAVVDLLAQVRQLSTISERDLIGRELADTVIQQLFATGVSVQGLARHVSSPERTLGGIAGIVGQIDATIKQIRQAVESAPPLMTVRGLRGGLLDVVRDHTLALGFEPTVQFRGELGAGVDRRCAEAVLGALDQALCDIEDRASATRVKLTLIVGDESLELHVQDDDRPGEADRCGADLALVSRRERVAGCEIMRDASDDGLHLRFRVPNGDWEAQVLV